MKLFITGGTGYLGQSVVKEALLLKQDATVLTRSESKEEKLKNQGVISVMVTCLRMAFGKQKSNVILQAMSLCHCEFIFHEIGLFLQLFFRKEILDIDKGGYNNHFKHSTDHQQRTPLYFLPHSAYTMRIQNFIYFSIS